MKGISCSPRHSLLV